MAQLKESIFGVRTTNGCSNGRSWCAPSLCRRSANIGRVGLSKLTNSAPLRSSLFLRWDLTLGMDFYVEMDVVIDDVLAEEAEEFAGAVVTAISGAVEGEDALVVAMSAFVASGDEDGDSHRLSEGPSSTSSRSSNHAVPMAMLEWWPRRGPILMVAAAPLSNSKVTFFQFCLPVIERVCSKPPFREIGATGNCGGRISEW
jgi:hypothetical protein